MNKTGFNLNKKSQKFYKPTLIECFLLPYCNLAPLIKWPLLRNIMDSFEVQVKWDAETIIVSTLVLKPLFDLASSEEKIHIYICCIKLKVPGLIPLIIQLLWIKEATTNFILSDNCLHMYSLQENRATPNWAIRTKVCAI